MRNLFPQEGVINTVYLESKKQNKNLVEILSRLQEKNLSSGNVETLQKVIVTCCILQGRPCKNYYYYNYY